MYVTLLNITLNYCGDVDFQYYHTLKTDDFKIDRSNALHNLKYYYLYIVLFI